MLQSEERAGASAIREPIDFSKELAEDDASDDSASDAGVGDKDGATAPAAGDTAEASGDGADRSTSSAKGDASTTAVALQNLRLSAEALVRLIVLGTPLTTHSAPAPADHPVIGTCRDILENLEHWDDKDDA